MLKAARSLLQWPAAFFFICQRGLLNIHCITVRTPSLAVHCLAAITAVVYQTAVSVECAYAVIYIQSKQHITYII